MPVLQSLRWIVRKDPLGGLWFLEITKSHIWLLPFDLSPSRFLRALTTALYLLLDLLDHVRVRDKANLIFLVVAPALLRRSGLDTLSHLPEYFLPSPKIFVLEYSNMHLYIVYKLYFFVFGPRTLLFILIGYLFILFSFNFLLFLHVSTAFIARFIFVRVWDLIVGIPFNFSPTHSRSSIS